MGCMVGAFKVMGCMIASFTEFSGQVSEVGTNLPVVLQLGRDKAVESPNF